VKIALQSLHKDAIIPNYQTPEAAGFDLHAIEDVTLLSGARGLIGTGLAMALEMGYELQIRPRSGLAYKHGITVLNAPGTVDSDYRGEVKVLLINHGTESFEIKKGDRIAQGVVQRVIQATFENVEKLPDSIRGSGGFGSTGTS